MRFVLQSSRGSGDLDATVGTNKDRVDPQHMYERLKKACQDLDIELPRPAELEGGDRAVTFAPIEWRDPIDLNEQAAEKMRCLVERSKVGDGWDVELLWRWRANLDVGTIRDLVPQKLTSGKDHNARALEGVKRRYEAWDRERGRDLPRDGGPTRDEMRDACNSAIKDYSCFSLSRPRRFDALEDQPEVDARAARAGVDRRSHAAIAKDTIAPLPETRALNDAQQPRRHPSRSRPQGELVWW